MSKSRFGLLDQVESIPLETKKRLKKKYNNDEQGGNDKKYVETTYSELKKLRDEGKLVSGAMYRITDYKCTTTQENTRSAGHRFDIITQALDEKTLSENANAIQHKYTEKEIPKRAYSPADGGFVKFVGVIEINGAKYCNYVVEEYENYQYAFDIDNIKFDWIGQYGDYEDAPEYIYYFIPNYKKYPGNTDWVDDSDSLLFKEDLREFSYFSNSNLAAWKLKYYLNNDENRFCWARNIYLSPISHNKCIKVVTDDSENYIYVRQSQLDNENGLAWAYSGQGDEKSIKEFSEINNINNESLDLADIIYTNSENLYIGETVNMGEASVTIVDFSEEGTGVIYKMIDEYNNECSYDFKNIMFYRTGSTIKKIYNYFDNNNNIYLYTFSRIGDDNVSDLSIVGQTLKNDEDAYQGVFGNIIKECSANMFGYYDKNEFCFALPNNVIISHFEYDDGLFYGCINNIFECNCILNTFGDDCSYNKLGSGSTDNIFGTKCKNNNFDCFCSNNNFGANCHSNIFGSNCTNNVFGEECTRNIFGISCYNNNFDNYCSNNTLEDVCNDNTFGHDFYNVILENGCRSIRFGSFTLTHCCTNIKIAAGCSYLRIYSNDDVNASNNNRLKNVYITQGLYGTVGQPLNVCIPNRNLEYETKVAKNSNGDLKIYCEADLAN